MIWNRLTQKQANIFDMVKINDRILLDVDGKLYSSRVEDISENQLLVATPIHQGDIVRVQPGQSVAVQAYTDNEMHRFSSVVKLILEGRVFCAVLSDFHDEGKVQNREYIRVTAKVPVRYRKDSPWDKSKPWRDASTQDISGGGVHLVGSTLLYAPHGEMIELEMCLPGEKSVHAMTRIIRSWKESSPTGSTSHLALQFVQIHPKERRQIIQFVQKREIEARGEELAAT